MFVDLKKNVLEQQSFPLLSYSECKVYDVGHPAEAYCNCTEVGKRLLTVCIG
jgi:hypothetical protein